MEDDASTPNTLLESLSENTLDFDLMDELLCDGYWLETIEGSNFWQPGFSTSSDLNFSSSYVSTSEANMDQFVPKPHQQNNQEGRERSDFGDNQPLVYPQMDELVQSQTRNREVILAKASSGQSENFLVGSTEMNKRLWIAPRENPSPHSSVRNRLMLAVEYLRELTKDSDVLIQMWLPIRKGGKQILITDNQPSSFNPNSKSLASYRDVSKRYHFAAEENSDDFPGMPGRVFLKKLPEWTPDVRFFRRDEYPRVIYAQQCNVSGSLALPVFERESGTCLGVVEIVTTTQKIKYRPELENISKALEAVDLRSSENSCPIIVKACDNSYQAALAEIQEFLISVCNTHGLPLAQTWVPCIERGKPCCRHSNENNPLCLSTVDSACYIRDEKVLPFHEACSEHQLLIGEGIVGRAFTTNQPCFATDITAISKTDYPLSHYAKMFQLCGSVAIRLRSIYTGTNDFVLEFFLPYECKDGEEQRQMWRLLISEIQRGCRSLRVVTDYELERENRVPSSGKIAESDHKLDSTFFKEHSQEELSYIGHLMEAQPKGKAASISLGYQKEEIGEDFKETTHWEYANIHLDTGSKGIVESGRDFCFIRGQHQSGVRKPEKRRTKTEKTISLQVLRQYFAGSLKDAAKSIGVCPTTLKRICRQHGITRWPSRKIKKVGHSLRKLQLVIDSVQGVEGAIQLNSFYSNFPELSSPNIPNTSSTLKMDDQLKPSSTQLEASLLSPVTTTSKSPSSSCNQSSSSSYCCSTEAKPPPVSTSFPEQPNGVLKRVSSNIELHGSSQEERKLLVRSHSHKILSELPNPEALPPFSNLRGPLSKVGSGFRVKANFGEEKFRFTLQQNWGFGDIRKEIVKRFHIDENCKIDLKYLDDDSEWVLLTCDADLEECIDIHRSTKSRTIKISVHQAFNSTLGSSFGSSSPS